VGAERAAAAIGWQTAASSIGGAIGPAGAGVVLDAAGLAAYGPIVVGGSLALAAAVAALGRGPTSSG